MLDEDVDHYLVHELTTADHQAWSIQDAGLGSASDETWPCTAIESAQPSLPMTPSCPPGASRYVPASMYGFIVRTLKRARRSLRMRTRFMKTWLAIRISG